MGRDDDDDAAEPAHGPRPRGHAMSLPPTELPAVPGVVGLGLGLLSGGGGAALGLSELEEYNRLLQETQARQEAVLRQAALLRREMGALRAARQLAETGIETKESEVERIAGTEVEKRVLAVR